MPYELRYGNLRLLYDDKLLDRNTAAREITESWTRISRKSHPLFIVTSDIAKGRCHSAYIVVAYSANFSRC